MYSKARAAALANDKSFHLAAILGRGKSIIKIGTNTGKTSPKYGRRYKNGDMAYCLHAETNVLRFSRPGDTITVMRWGATGELTMAKPCQHCMHYIRVAGIKKITYSDWDGSFKTFKV